MSTATPPPFEVFELIIYSICLLCLLSLMITYNFTRGPEWLQFLHMQCLHASGCVNVFYVAEGACLV